MLSPQLCGIKGRVEHHLSSCPRDGHVETAFSTAAVQRPEVERQHSLIVHAERHRKEDHVSLVTLHVLKILDEEPLLDGVLQRLQHPAVLVIAQETLDQPSLLLVERDDADRWAPLALMLIEALLYSATMARASTRFVRDSLPLPDRSNVPFTRTRLTP